MTDEEKKEFEEFLQWKAEKKKREEEEQAKQKESSYNGQSVSHNNSSETQPSKHNIERDTKLSNFAGFGVLIAIGIVIILSIAIAISNSSNNSSTQDASYTADSTEILKHEKASAEKASAEKAKNDSIANVKRIQTLKHSIRITKVSLSSPNSANGVSATFRFKNTSKKTIKYLVWMGYPINAVGDVVDCEIRGYSDFRGQVTGPIKPGHSNKGSDYWDCAWYNSTAKKIVLTGIEIEYMDGSRLDIAEDELEYVR